MENPHADALQVANEATQAAQANLEQATAAHGEAVQRQAEVQSQFDQAAAEQAAAQSGAPQGESEEASEETVDDDGGRTPEEQQQIDSVQSIREDVANLIAQIPQETIETIQAVAKREGIEGGLYEVLSGVA